MSQRLADLRGCSHCDHLHQQTACRENPGILPVSRESGKTAEGREYSKDRRANVLMGLGWRWCRGLSHSGRRPPRKATRPITAWFKAVRSVLSLYETLIYCVFCLKRQKRKRGKKYPSWRRGGAVNSGVNLRGFSHSCAVRRSHSRNNSSFFFIHLCVCVRQAGV